jgi:hypothetical protein
MIIIGLQILRMMMSFFILQRHCFNINLTKNKIIITIYHGLGFYISTFYIISYFLSYKTLKFRNIIKIKLRLQRFLIPYIIWPLLIFLLNNIFYIFGAKVKHRKLKDLFIQLITGKRIYGILWFQCNLIISFILFSIIALSTKNEFLFIVQLFGIVGNFYHSLHYYYKLFNIYILEIRSLFQDFGKVLLYSSIGITLSSLIDINNLRKKKKKVMFFSLISVYLIKDFAFIKNKFYYLRCTINGIAAISFFIFFSVISISNKKIISLILIITNYTGGVYYLHLILWKILRRKLQIFNKKTLFGCFFNYIMCYFICFVGDKIFGKTNFKYLFI